MSTKVKAKLKPIPYVLKTNFLSVVIDRKQFALESGHPTFDRLKKALKTQNWARVPKLVSIAEAISNESKGAITVKAGGIYYKGELIHSSLATRMMRMVKERKPIHHMVIFMDQLYKNPFGERARLELFDWLDRNKLPITDDGCFVAYKAVSHNYRDHHTGNIDNSVGQIVMMPRKEVDPNRHNECSYGLHFCSRTYLPNFHHGSSRVMKLKINPKDVVSIPTDYGYAKGRCMKYEVIGEVSTNEVEQILDITDIKDFMTSVVPIAGDRKNLLKQVLAHPSIKKALKQGKVKRTSILKNSFGRLQKLAEKLSLAKVSPQLSEKAKHLEYPLKAAREAAKVFPGQIAKDMGITRKQLQAIESREEPTIEQVDKYLLSLAKLSGVSNIRQSALSLPLPTVMVQ